MGIENETHLLEGTNEVFEGTDVLFFNMNDFRAFQYTRDVLYSRGDGNFSILLQLPDGLNAEEPIPARIMNNEPERMHTTTFFSLGSQIFPVFSTLLKTQLPEHETIRITKQVADSLVTQRLGKPSHPQK